MQAKINRRSSMKTSDMRAAFVSGNTIHEAKAKGRIVKPFVTGCDTKRLKVIKPFRGDRGRGDDAIRDHLIQDGDIQSGGFISRRNLGV